MVKVKETTIEERQIILDLRKDGKSFRCIAKLVHKPLSTIHYIVKKFNEDNIVANRPRIGRHLSFLNETKDLLSEKLRKTHLNRQVVSRLNLMNPMVRMLQLEQFETKLENPVFVLV